MNPVLEQIITTLEVTDGTVTLPLRHPSVPHLPVAIDPEEGRFLGRIIDAVKPSVSLEIGMAYGVSTLYICEALSQLPKSSARHIVMDPFQSTQWRGIGLLNVGAAGFAHMVEFHEDRSEFVLPRLLAGGTQIDFAFIDGWHTFDQVLLEFFYVNRMLSVGGVIAFDDAERRGINRVIRHALSYSAYRVFEPERGMSPKVTLGGRLRRRLSRVSNASKVVRRDVLQRDWDLGIHSTCVAIQKVAEDKRGSGWEADF
jgi:predicted O-methyltransferase YrrM